MISRVQAPAVPAGHRAVTQGRRALALSRAAGPGAAADHLHDDDLTRSRTVPAGHGSACARTSRPGTRLAGAEPRLRLRPRQPQAECRHVAPAPAAGSFRKFAAQSHSESRRSPPGRWARRRRRVAAAVAGLGLTPPWRRAAAAVGALAAHRDCQCTAQPESLPRTRSLIGPGRSPPPPGRGRGSAAAGTPGP